MTALLLMALTSLPSPAGPPPTTATTPFASTALTYITFAVSIITGLGYAISTVRKARTRREQNAAADKDEATAGSLSSGVTLEGWKESRQEVRDARADAKEARDRADELGHRLDESESDNRSLRRRIERLEDQLHDQQAMFTELNRRIASCPVDIPPGCPLQHAVLTPDDTQPDDPQPEGTPT